MSITAQEYSAGIVKGKSESSNAAGIPEVVIISEFDIDLDLLKWDIFYSSEEKTNRYIDGHDFLESIPVEDMMPYEYRQVVNGNV